MVEHAAFNANDLHWFDPIALDASNDSGFETHTGPVSGDTFSLYYLQR